MHLRDHALVPRARLDAFVEHAQAYVDGELPGLTASEDCTGIITERHLDRIVGLVDEAREWGARIVSLGGEADPATRHLPSTLVVDPLAGLRIMPEEIFGPILPVVPYEDLDAALAELGAGERPLGLYVFGQDAKVAERVLRQTTSGGACVNVCTAQGTLPSLGFGGVGQSGNDRHHGIDGFREFSNPRAVVVRGTGDLIDAFVPPWADLAQAVVDGALAGGETTPHPADAE